MVVQFPPEVPGEEVAVIPGLLRRHVKAPESAGYLAGDAGASRPGRPAQARVVQISLGQGAQSPAAGVVRQPLQPGQLPPAGLAGRVPCHPPLDLGPGQRVQAPQVDLRGPGHRGCGGAPPAERRLISERDGNGQAGPLELASAEGRQRRPARVALFPVACLVPGAQAQRRECHFRTGPHEAATVTGNRFLPGQPPAEIDNAGALLALIAVPAVLMVETQPPGQVESRPVRAYPAGQLLLRPLACAEQRGFPEEDGPCPAFPALLLPQVLVSTAQVIAARYGALAPGCQAVPAVGGMPRRDRDDVAAEQRVEGRGADQRGQDLQPVPSLPGIRLRQQRERHRPSPQTVRRAASNAGSCTSTWP